MTPHDEHLDELIRRALDARDPLRGGVELPPPTLTLAQMRECADRRLRESAELPLGLRVRRRVKTFIQAVFKR